MMLVLHIVCNWAIHQKKGGDRERTNKKRIRNYYFSNPGILNIIITTSHHNPRTHPVYPRACSTAPDAWCTTPQRPETLEPLESLRWQCRMSTNYVVLVVKHRSMCSPRSYPLGRQSQCKTPVPADPPQLQCNRATTRGRSTAEISSTATAITEFNQNN